MAPHSSTLAWKIHGRRSLVGCSPWGRYESDTTERLHFQFSLSCIGEGNGNPLQCSCLENPMDRGAWWAAVYGVAQSRTWLKWLSSSSSSSNDQITNVSNDLIITNISNVRNDPIDWIISEMNIFSVKLAQKAFIWLTLDVCLLHSVLYLVLLPLNISVEHAYGLMCCNRVCLLGLHKMEGGEVLLA